MKKLLVFTILALISSAPHSWGYDTPIENQSVEVIDDDIWNIGGMGHLMVGNNGRSSSRKAATPTPRTTPKTPASTKSMFR